MRVTVLLFILLLTNDLMGQRILLFDKENNTKVINVNMSNNIKGTTSDVNGFADLNVSVNGYDAALQVSNKLQELYFDGKFDKCIIVFNKFKSAISQEVTQQQLIPLDVSDSSKEENVDDSAAKAIYDYEPDEETILKDLLPKNVSIQIFKVLLESDAGEHGARMAAMDNATRNAGEMIDSLTLKYNRTRQAFITKELIEIISGAESI